MRQGGERTIPEPLTFGRLCADLTLALGCAVAFLWPTGSPVEQALGDPLGETDNHLWMFWRARARLAGADCVVNAPDCLDLPLMDVVNLPAWLLGALISPTFGLYVVAVAAVAIGMVGGWVLGREVAGAPGATVAMVATGCAPFLAGVIDFGITEAWPIGWLALHLGLALRTARTRRWSDALWAGLALGATALAGWYMALWALIVEAGLVIWLVWRASSRRGLLGLIAAQGVVALACVLPALTRFLAVQEQWEPRFRAPPPGAYPWRPNWHELPIFGTDLLNLVLPRLDPVAVSKSCYLGIVVLALAVLGVARRPAVAGPLLLIATPLVVLSLGYWPTVAGHPLGVPGPAYFLVGLVEPLSGISHWHRAVGGAVPLFAAAAAVGASSLPRVRGVVPLLAVLVAADGIALSQTAWPRTTFPVTAPSVLAQLPGDGGVIQLPFDNGRRDFSDEPARIYNRWQVVHEKPVAENYEGRDALLFSSRLVASANTEAGVPTTLPPYYQPPANLGDASKLADQAVLAAEVAQLRAWGYRWIVLHRTRAHRPAATIRLLDGWLGRGTQVDGPLGHVVWDLERASRQLNGAGPEARRVQQGRKSVGRRSGSINRGSPVGPRRLLGGDLGGRSGGVGAAGRQRGDGHPAEGEEEECGEERRGSRGLFVLDGQRTSHGRDLQGASASAWRGRARVGRPVFWQHLEQGACQPIQRGEGGGKVGGRRDALSTLWG